jgi:hypothetical protein
MQSNFVLAHLPVRLTRPSSLEQLNIENLTTVVDEQEYVNVEFAHNNIILKKCDMDNYVYKVRQFRHKENKYSLACLI